METISYCQACLKAGKIEEAKSHAVTLEQDKPKSEAEWLKLHNIFLQLKKPEWAEVMTDRFLIVEPNNTRARLEKLSFLADVAVAAKKDDPIKLRGIVEDLDQISEKIVNTADEQYLLATLYAKCLAEEKAARHFDLYLSINPHRIDVRLSAIRNFINLPNLSRARAEILILSQLGSSNISVLLSTMKLTFGINDRFLLEEMLLRGVKIVNDDDYISKIYLSEIASRANRTDIARSILLNTKIAQIKHVAPLKDLFCSIQGKGLIKSEQEIIEQILSLDPMDSEYLNLDYARRAPFAVNIAACNLNDAGVVQNGTRLSACISFLWSLLARK
jgi:hypothetical protein